LSIVIQKATYDEVAMQAKFHGLKMKKPYVGPETFDPIVDEKGKAEAMNVFERMKKEHKGKNG